MARTQQEIYDAMETDAAARAALIPINNGSITGRFKQMKMVFAFAANQLELIWDNFTALINSIIAAGKPLTCLWYQQRSLEFQYGDTLILINNAPAYAIIDSTKRIVAFASCTDDRSNGFVIIKAAKNVSGVITPLSTIEKTSFVSYINAIQGAGDRIIINSLSSDLLKLSGRIWYNGQIPLATMQAAVHDAVAAYLAAIEFNGRVQVLHLEDAIEALNGLNDMDLTYQAKQGISAYRSFTGRYDTVAGYIILDETAGNTISDLITFIAE
jgi:hypothetical protein